MSVAMEDFPRRHRITVEEYHRMGEVGLIAPDARVELIDGEIIDMPTMGELHAATTRRLDGLLHRVVGERAIVSCQLPVELSNFSEPMPDFSLLLPRDDFYVAKHPTAADTLLLVEVSDTTLRYDMGRKLSLYARHGVPEYWVVDVQGRQVHVFRNPSDAVYRETLCHDGPSVIAISSLPGVHIDLSPLLSLAPASER